MHYGCLRTWTRLVAVQFDCAIPFLKCLNIFLGLPDQFFAVSTMLSSGIDIVVRARYCCQGRYWLGIFLQNFALSTYGSTFISYSNREIFLDQQDLLVTGSHQDDIQNWTYFLGFFFTGPFLQETEQSCFSYFWFHWPMTSIFMHIVLWRFSSKNRFEYWSAVKR